MNYTNEINIKTGESRDCRYLWYIRISEELRPTVVSKALHGQRVDVKKIEEWHTVNLYATKKGAYSAHYRFHGALHQVGQMHCLWLILELNDEERAESARKLLTHWQNSKGDSEAGDYIDDLNDRALNKQKTSFAE